MSTDQSKGYSVFRRVPAYDFGDGRGPREAFLVETWFGWQTAPPPGMPPQETRYFETEAEAARFILERGEVFD